MGIAGLTTYITDHSDLYLRDFKLHDSYLIVDGNNILRQLYIKDSKCNPAFGGDYDTYAKCVSQFFDDLLICNVTPLVLFDGGSEDKKLNTTLRRFKEKIISAASWQHLGACCGSPFPTLLIESFLDVLQDKRIKYAQCMFEADNTIAAIAIILNCPVLSYDSDFYIYGSSYIPFDAMDNCVLKSTSGNGYVKPCKIYRIEYFLLSFTGLLHSHMHLAAFLLGNDYVDRTISQYFFRYIQIQKAGMKINKQGLIEATFKWLSNYTLDEAIFKILSIIPNNRRREVLDIIETNQNAYTTASVDILKYLDLPEEYVSRANAHFKTGTFKFNEDLDNLMYREKMSQVKMSDNNNEVQVNKLAEKGFSPPNMIIDKMPSWFIDDFSMAKFPKYFVDILTQDFYICPIQIEDYSYPSSSIISMEIVSAIYRLLTSGTDRKQNYIQYIIRGENNTVLSHELEPDMKLSIHESWSVHCLRNIPMSARRALVNQVLGITDEHIIQELPAEWMLYLAISKYWVDKQQKELQSSCSIYVLLFSMLWHIIDSKIGYYRTLHQFHVKYQKKIEETQHMRKRNDYRPSYPTTATIAEALNTVNLSDCLVAAPFFISHFQFNDKLRVNPKKFNITVVHILAEFQSCLRESLHLNALLGCPYMPTTIANMFNGTFLYNLYVNFNKRNDIEAYINHVLKESPSLLHLFNVLLAKVKPLYTILQYKVIHNKVRKTKFNKKVQAETEQEEPKIIVDEDPSFYDPNNPYSLLSCTTQCN